MPKVVVALSGGVDSSVAALLLTQKQFDVHGITIRLWSESGCEQENRCCTPKTRQIAARLARKLGIPFEILDGEDRFYGQVVKSFIAGYTKGTTPHPCIICNQQIKWAFLLSYAERIGADFVATGHYARVVKRPNNQYELWKGVDRSKDQSYVLCRLTQDVLRHTLFPLGALMKEEVWKIAQDSNLPSSDQPESQDLCFLGNKDHQTFLLNHAPQTYRPGQVINRKGQLLGEHKGLAFYTIGQRKGLPSAPRALYVLEKRIEDNILVVGFQEELGKKELSAISCHWIAGIRPEKPFEAQIKIRSKAQAVRAWITPGKHGELSASFSQSLRDITPGQTAVIYDDEKVIGCGIIH